LQFRPRLGSSKTTSLVQAVSRYKQVFPDATVRYLVFGALNSEEAQREFGDNAVASTLHSYAYSQVVKRFKLGQIKPFLTWRDLPKSIKRPFGSDYDLLVLVDDYCKSDHLSLDLYAAAESDANPEFRYNLIAPAKQILNMMAGGNLAITHSFYLKLFHVLVMDGTIQLASVDRLLVDEFQDMSGLALDIINAIPAEQKVFVGDVNQSIFTFLKLRNGFKQYPDAKVLTLSKSFRVDASYAPAIQAFLRKYLEPDAVFEGMEYPTDPAPTPVTKAYLTRTNNSLITKMIELNKAGIPYHLSSKAKLKQMFKLPLALIYAKPAFDQKDSELKHLQHDIDDWGSLSEAKRKEISLVKYLRQANPDDTKLASAITLILKFGSKDILNAYEHANDHKSKPCNLSLLTGHTSKGSTFDEVELDNDLNEAITDIIARDPSTYTDDERSELCLYFVCISRMRFKLINAKHLPKENQ